MVSRRDPKTALGYQEGLVWLHLGFLAEAPKASYGPQDNFRMGVGHQTDQVYDSKLDLQGLGKSWRQTSITWSMK